MKHLEISEKFLKSLTKLKGKHKVVDDVLRLPGMNFFMGLLSFLQKGAKGLEKDIVMQIEKILIVEFLECEGKMKSVLANFLRVKFRNDEEFRSRSLDVLFEAFKEFSLDIIEEGKTEGNKIFENPVRNIAKLKTVIVTLELVSELEDVLFDEGVLKMLFHVNLLLSQNFNQTLQDKNYVTFKQIELMIENLKIFNYCLKDKIWESKVKNGDEETLEFVDKTAEILKNLFSEAPKLNRDLLFHICYLVYHHQILKGNENFRVEFFENTHNLEGDAIPVTNIAKARAFVNYTNSFDLNEKLIKGGKEGEKLTIVESLVKYAHYSQINIKQNAFRVLNDFLKIISTTEESCEELRASINLRNSIFDIILQSWEFPIRGFANFMEEVFENFIKCLNSDEIGKLIGDIEVICTAPTRRKFASSRIVLKHITIEEFLEKNPNVLTELLEFDQKANDNSVVMLFRTILEKKYKLLMKGKKREKKKVEKNLSKFKETYEKWIEFWIEDYIKVLKRVNKKVANEIVEYIHPPTFDICSESIVLAINRINKEDQSHDNILAAKIGLIRLARSTGLLVLNEARDNYHMEHLEQEKNWHEELKEMITHSNRHIVLDAIRTVTEPRKVSELPLKWEYQLFETIFMFDFKNSYPQFRNDLIVVINKLFQRLRNVMNKDFKKINSKQDFEKVMSKSENLRNFVNFLANFKKLFIANVYPDAPFESSYPYLKSLHAIYEIFKDTSYVFRNKNVYDPTRILYYIDFYSVEIFDILISSFKCQWDTVRKICYKILKEFPTDLDYFNDEFKKEKLLNPSKVLMSSPVIKDVEAATYSFGLAFELEASIEKKFDMIEDMLASLKEKKDTMENAFLEGKSEFAQSLYHGILTTLSITLCDQDNFKIYYKSDKERLTKIFKILIEEITNIINFAKAVISKNTETFILDNEDTRNHIIKMRKNDYKKIIDKLDSANTLLDAHEEDEDRDDVNTDNISVVAFYLVSKESGNLFAKMSNLIGFSENNPKFRGIFEQDDIIALVENFTESLLSIKHLGAIDNIATGLTILCKSLYDTSNKKYAELIQSMMDKILKSLKKDEFKSIFRRSAGLPSAITALMKAEPRGRRIKLLPYCLNELFSMARDETLSDFTRIHSLNILKYTFQDAQLKVDLEHYIGEGLKLAIIGFTDNDWSIRNSSLMVYSAIINRMFVKSNDNKINHKNKLNIIQFFLRAPNLIKFFIEEIDKFSKSNEFNQYPSLYPICLIFSKLLPYDMKDDSLIENKDIKKVTDVHITQSRVILPSEIKTFKNLLLSCTGHKNYLGRVLVARALVPFIPINKLDEVFEKSIPIKKAEIKRDHNKTQGMLLVCKYALRNFLGIYESSNYSLELEKPTEEIYLNIVECLSKRQEAFVNLKCTPVFLNFVEIVIELKKHGNKEKGLIFDYSKFKVLIEKCKNLLKNVYNGKPIRAVFDVCESELIDRITRFIIGYYQQSDQSSTANFLGEVDEILKNRLSMLNTDDTNPLVSLFETLNSLNQTQFRPLVTPERVELYLNCCQNILRENPKAVNLVEFLVQFLSKSIKLQNSGLELDSLSGHFFKIMRLAQLEQYKENMKIMEELLPISALFAFKLEEENRYEFLVLISKLLKDYSNPDQKDNLRYACVEALEYLLPHIDAIISSSVEIYLKLMESLAALVTDEYAEIRLAASKLIKGDNNMTFNDNKALVILFRKIFRNLKKTFESEIKEDDLTLIKNFIFRNLSEPEFEKYKYMALYNSRIFNYDKPNKYREDVKVINAMISGLKASGLDLKITTQDYEKFIEENSVKQAHDFEKELRVYFGDVFTRNEFIFGKGVQKMAISSLSGDEEYAIAKNYFKQFLLSDY